MSHFITPNARRFPLLTALLLTLAGPQAATANETGFRYQSSHGPAIAIRLATDGSHFGPVSRG